ncbi:antifreeze protein [Palleronia rufa]|uniref:antifreeze protein n=1 Tax=Palleronia rufa TaxID=1530186 RepID=UPI001F46541E|nr:antifreeze protein [Palleronia rufa]
MRNAVKEQKMYGQGYMDTTIGAMRMMMEAQAVVTYRVLGMMGFWPVAPSENWRMTMEKGPAFAAAQQGAMAAMIAGKTPDLVAAAWLKPIGGKTRSNQRRLSKRR